jgi:glycosyltransferase involved in cell wall biosynthesis
MTRVGSEVAQAGRPVPRGRRVVIFTDAWVPQVNGVVRTLSRTIGGLLERGFDVTCVAPDLFAGVPFTRHAGLTLALPPYDLDRFITPGCAIHIATEGPIGIAARAYCDRRGLAYTTAFHTHFPLYARKNFGLPEPLVFALLRRFHRASRAVMVPTRSVMELLDRHGFKRLVLWQRGVDTQLFHPRRLEEIAPEHRLSPELGPRPWWLYVGRVSPEKDIDRFLSLDLPGTKIVVGDGPDRERLEQAFPEARILGLRTGLALACVYNQADVFVFPSRFETYGLVVAEAIASGLPVAAFPVTGPIDIVRQGRTGVLDEDLAAACMAALALDRSGVRDAFSWDRSTDQFVDHLAFPADNSPLVRPRRRAWPATVIGMR